MKKLLRILILLVILGAVAGHIIYWYWPRERAAAPEPGGLPARLLASGQYGACLWIPYPHQNLGKLSGSIADGSDWLAAAARVAEVPPPVLPSFGPFAVPPSRELAVCSDLDGRRFFAVARVYPGLAAVARLAGRVAGNPWLSGGQVRETRGRRSEVEERVLNVAWQDGFWIVSGGAAPQLEAAATAEPFPRNLGIFHLERDVSDFPAGDYVLQRQGGDLEVALLGGGEPPAPPAAEDKGAPVLLAAAGPVWPADSPKPLAPAAMVLFDTRGGLDLGPLGQMPGAAVYNAPGSRRWGLPARGLAAILSERLPQGSADGWEIVALDDDSLGRAETLAPQITALSPPGGDGGLILGLWARPRPALRLVTQLRRGFEKVPLVERRQVERWRDWETLLQPLAPCDRVSLAASRSPSAFRLRLYGCD